MRITILFCLLLALCSNSSAQKTNVKAGLWGDPTVWSGNTIPVSSDEVELHFDVTININASCRSLIVNGHIVTINTGFNLNITGNDKATTLSAFIELDTTQTAPFDTLSKMVFEYDAAKRHTGKNLQYYDNGAPNNYRYKSVLYYNGTDTLPFKRVLLTPLLQPTDYDYSTDTSYYFYNNGIISGDSSIQLINNFSSTTVNKYRYFSDRVIKTVTEYSSFSPDGSTTADTISVTYLNGNIIHQNNSNRDYIYLYDNHPNPFYRTQSKIAINNAYPLYEFETLIDEVFAKNNVLQIDQSAGSNEYHVKFSYQYKANGYPKSVIITNDDYPDEVSKGVYIYTE